MVANARPIPLSSLNFLYAFFIVCMSDRKKQQHQFIIDTNVLFKKNFEKVSPDEYLGKAIQSWNKFRGRQLDSPIMPPSLPSPQPIAPASPQPQQASPALRRPQSTPPVYGKQQGRQALLFAPADSALPEQKQVTIPRKNANDDSVGKKAAVANIPQAQASPR